jgi:hypothetical protein
VHEKMNYLHIFREYLGRVHGVNVRIQPIEWPEVL